MGKINEKMMSSKIVKKEGGFVFDYSSFENLLQKIGFEYLCRKHSLQTKTDFCNNDTYRIMDVNVG